MRWMVGGMHGLGVGVGRRRPGDGWLAQACWLRLVSEMDVGTCLVFGRRRPGRGSG